MIYIPIYNPLFIIGKLFSYLNILTHSIDLNRKDIYQIIYSHHWTNWYNIDFYIKYIFFICFLHYISNLSSNSSSISMEPFDAEAEISLSGECSEEEIPMQGKRKYSALDILNENYGGGIMKTKYPKIITVDNFNELINDKNGKGNTLVCDRTTKYSDALSDNINAVLGTNEVDVIPVTPSPAPAPPPTKSIVSNEGIKLHKGNRKQALLETFFARK